MKTIMLALSLCVLSLVAFGQRAVRSSVISHTAADGGTTNVLYRFGDVAQGGDAAVSIAWMTIYATNTLEAATNGVNLEVIAYDYSYTNVLYGVNFIAGGESNVTYYTSETLGAWPVADWFRFSTDSTAVTFRVWMGLKVTR